MYDTCKTARFRQFILLLSFLTGSILYVNSFADSLYSVQKGDSLGKIVAKNYPFRQRVSTKQQIMVAILRANPTAFQGGNIHFLKKINQLVLPSKSSIRLIPKDEAVKTIKEHLKFFKQKKTGDFPAIPLQRPSIKPEKKVNQKDTNNKKEAIPPTAITSKILIVKEKISNNNNKEIIETTNITDKELSTKKVPNKKEISNAKNKEESNKIESLKIKDNIPKIKEAIKNEITIYNWNNFLPKNILKSFTQVTGVKVNYFTYTKEEVVYEKIKALNGRGYDLLILSAELVQKMRDNGLLQAIDHRKLKNFTDLNPKLLNKFFDPDNEFSIPYLWSTLGIGINRGQTESENITHWKDLWHKKWKNKLLLYDNMRYLFAIALKVNGHSINSRDSDEIKQAYQKLRKLIPNIKRLSSFLELNNRFLIKAESAGIIKNPSALKLKRKLPNFQYIYPKEGSIFFTANFVIPSHANNIENTYAFINYLLRPEIAVRCVKGLNQSTPNLEALKLLDKHLSQDTILFPDEEVFEKAEFDANIGKTKEIYQLYWRKLKQEIKIKQLDQERSH